MSCVCSCGKCLDNKLVCICGLAWCLHKGIELDDGFVTADRRCRRGVTLFQTYEHLRKQPPGSTQRRVSDLLKMQVDTSLHATGIKPSRSEPVKQNRLEMQFIPVQVEPSAPSAPPLNMDDFLPHSGNPAPAPGHHAPAPGHHAPAPGYHALAPGYHAPAPGHHAPAPGYHALAPGYHAPAPGYHALAPGHHAPAPGYHALAPGHHAPAPGYPAPGYPAPGYPAPGYPAPGYPAPGYPARPRGRGPRGAFPQYPPY
jgi:hypothetical protein